MNYDFFLEHNPAFHFNLQRQNSLRTLRGKELPLVALAAQCAMSFATAGFPLQSGLEKSKKGVWCLRIGCFFKLINFTIRYSSSSMVCDLEAFCSLANHLPQSCHPVERRVSFDANSSFSKIVIFAIRCSVTRSSMFCDLEAFCSLANHLPQSCHPDEGRVSFATQSHSFELINYNTPLENLLANHLPQTCRPNEGRVSFEAQTNSSELSLFDGL